MKQRSLLGVGALLLATEWRVCSFESSKIEHKRNETIDVGSEHGMVSRRDRLVIKKNYSNELLPSGKYNWDLSYYAEDVDPEEIASVRLDTCGRDSTFEAYVLVEHTLEDAEQISTQTRLLMEDAFKETYNSINMPKPPYSTVCDKDHMRVVEKVELSVSEVIYKKLESETLCIRNFIYKVSGRGADTDEQTSLFVTDPLTTKNPGYMHEPFNPDACTCPLATVEERGPTTEEFLYAFKMEVKLIASLKLIDNFKSVNRVVEYHAVDCKPKERTVFADVSVLFNEKHTTDDLLALTDSFQNSYNHLTVNYCDPLFRFVDDVTLVNPSPSRGLLRFLNRKRKKRTRRFDFRARVRARFGGSSKKRMHILDEVVDVVLSRRNTMMLDEMDDWNIDDDDDDDDERSSEQRLLDSSNSANFDWHHVFKGKNVCFCAARPKGLGTPSDTEFKKRYVAEIAKANVAEEYNIADLIERGNNKLRRMP